MLNLERIMSNLSNRRSIFHSEADFQFSLAWEIQSEHPDARVMLELPYTLEESGRVHLDILVVIEGRTIPIELKYKTTKFEYDFNDKARYRLANHGAQDLGKYDFLKDVERIEKCSRKMRSFEIGYSVFLTNDRSYWTPPKMSGTIYEQFDFSSGIKAGHHIWGSHASPGTIKGKEKEILLEIDYNPHWIEYSDLKINKGQFRYMLVEVKRNERNISGLNENRLFNNNLSE